MSFFIIASYVVIAVTSFLIGSIPFGVLVGKAAYDKDPRSAGSGSIGSTNMNRLFGWKASLATFVGDVGKGAIAVVLARVITGFVSYGAEWEFELAIVLSIMCVIFGHIFCPWLGFSGGKGIATGLGSFLVGYPLVAVSILSVFIIVVLFSKRISAGSIAAAAAIPVFSLLFCFGNIPLLVCGTVIAVVVIFAHRGNIERLRNGTEPKFTDKGPRADKINESEM